MLVELWNAVDTKAGLIGTSRIALHWRIISYNNYELSQSSQDQISHIGSVSKESQSPRSPKAPTLQL